MYVCVQCTGVCRYVVCIQYWRGVCVHYTGVCGVCGVCVWWRYASSIILWCVEVCPALYCVQESVEVCVVQVRLVEVCIQHFTVVSVYV